MRALNIKEPWATLIMQGGKTTENRTWPAEFSGPLLIVASKVPDVRDSDGWLHLAKLHTELALSEKPLGNVASLYMAWVGRKMASAPLLGHALGIVEMIGCDRAMVTSWDQPDQWHWRLSNPRLLNRPFLVKGRLGIYTVEDALIQEARGVA